MQQNLQTSREGRVLRVTLARPDKRNALSFAMCQSLTETIESAQEDASVGAILLDAEGDVFCAGMDLEEASSPGAVGRADIHERLFSLVARITKPIVAAVQGPALGGGVGLIANAHIAVAAHGCSFGLTEIRVGMWPFVIYRSIAYALGERRALELSLMGRIFNVPEALHWGLIHEAAPSIELDDRATAIAIHLAQSSPQAIRLGLEFVAKTHGLDSVAAAPIARQIRAEAFASSDFQEGVSAFLAKRRPSYFPSDSD